MIIEKEGGIDKPAKKIGKKKSQFHELFLPGKMHIM